MPTPFDTEWEIIWKETYRYPNNGEVIYFAAVKEQDWSEFLQNNEWKRWDAAVTIGCGGFWAPLMRDQFLTREQAVNEVYKYRTATSRIIHDWEGARLASARCKKEK